MRIILYIMIVNVTPASDFLLFYYQRYNNIVSWNIF